MKKKIILLISGKGTNAINITNYFQNNNSVEVSLILSNNQSSPIFENIKKYDAPAEFFNLSDFDNIPIHITKEYKQPKKELDKWKECGLKSLFLLKELDRLGATKYDNLAPIMDMIQDIQLPDHTELDKDIAGVPSAFTNLT